MNGDQDFDFTRRGPTPRVQPPLLSEPGPTADVRSSGSHLRNVPDAVFPKVGDVIEGCLLVAELGYGSSGYAFLAQELALADRPVVLKVTAGTHEEHLNLARLQHTHIMPLYWATVLGSSGLRALAMPFLARTTLSALLQRLESSGHDGWTGQQVFDELQADQADLPVQIPVQDHPAQTLQQSTWVQFVVHLGITIAEALAFAHRRGLLHLDIKPSNIVITPDGQPVLLDLDVARKPIPAGTMYVPWLGGTPTYMSPEQAAAMEALTREAPIPIRVDERSDVYSLGMVLYTALGGACDGKNRPDASSLSAVNPRVPRELADIIAHCLAPKPSDRYRDCNMLAEDLQRHLNDLPLKGIRTRLVERWRKWRRRRPLGMPVAVLFLCFGLAAGWASYSVNQMHAERRAQAEVALAEGLEFQRLGQHDAAIRRYLAGKDLADQARGAAHLRTQLARGLLSARRLQSASELDKAVHLMRFYALQEKPPRRMQHVLQAAGLKLWTDRDVLMDRSLGTLAPDVETNIESQLQELVLLWTDLQLRLTPAGQEALAQERVAQILKEAEQRFGMTPTIRLAKIHHGEMEGLPDGDATQTAVELCMLARFAMTNADFPTAERYLAKAIERAPLDFVANFHVGVLALRQKQHHRAIEAFSYCLGLDSTAECFLLRGEARAALGDTDAALRDFNIAIEKNAEFALAYEERANLHEKLGRVELARKDRERAGTLR